MQLRHTLGRELTQKKRKKISAKMLISTKVALSVYMIRPTNYIIWKDLNTKLNRTDYQAMPERMGQEKMVQTASRLQLN